MHCLLLQTCQAVYEVKSNACDSIGRTLENAKFFTSDTLQGLESLYFIFNIF